MYSPLNVEIYVVKITEHVPEYCVPTIENVSPGSSRVKYSP